MVEWVLTLLMLGAFAPLGYMFMLCCCDNPCPSCDGSSPDQFQVDLSGIVDGGSCINCSTFNTTWVVTRNAAFSACNATAQACFWRVGQTTPNASCTSSCALMVMVSQISAGPNFTLRVTAFNCSQGLACGTGSNSTSEFEKTDTSALACSTFASEAFAFTTNTGGKCDGSAATCLVTAL